MSTFNCEVCEKNFKFQISDLAGAAFSEGAARLTGWRESVAVARPSLIAPPLR
jgi:hypothetical protein